MKLHDELCTPEDLSRLTKLVRKTFKDAFEAHNNPADFSAYINTVLTEEQLGKELSHPDSSFYFVKEKETVVGYFKVNEKAAQTELKGSKSMELERIYVSREFQGMKIGQWILERVIEIARNKKKHFLWLGVWEHNTAAIKFYQRHGFAKFGEHPYYVGKDKQMDWLMRLDLVTLK
ncbi:MAG: GNAT family N-acetyltransferase [Eudoraea sp.]|nr:GNAT family N-acetyltransferase [Eudoraea sp.]